MYQFFIRGGRPGRRGRRPGTRARGARPLDRPAREGRCDGTALARGGRGGLRHPQSLGDPGRGPCGRGKTACRRRFGRNSSPSACGSCARRSRSGSARPTISRGSSKFPRRSATGFREMATLRITLRAGERVFVNGAVLKVDRKTTLEFLNDVTFLLEGHVIQAEDATTPLRQLYFTVQMMLIDPSTRPGRPGSLRRRARRAATDLSQPRRDRGPRGGPRSHRARPLLRGAEAAARADPDRGHHPRRRGFRVAIAVFPPPPAAGRAAGSATSRRSPPMSVASVSSAGAAAPAASSQNDLAAASAKKYPGFPAIPAAPRRPDVQSGPAEPDRFDAVHLAVRAVLQRRAGDHHQQEARFR